jgi:hypothetical protein
VPKKNIDVRFYLGVVHWWLFKTQFLFAVMEVNMTYYRGVYNIHTDNTKEKQADRQGRQLTGYCIQAGLAKWLPLPIPAPIPAPAPGLLSPPRRACIAGCVDAAATPVASCRSGCCCWSCCCCCLKETEPRPTHTELLLLPALRPELSVLLLLLLLPSEKPPPMEPAAVATDGFTLLLLLLP